MIRIIVTILIFVQTAFYFVSAKSYPTRSIMLGHYVTMNFVSEASYDVRNRSFGTFQQVGVSYEVSKDNFFANFGINLEYTLKKFSIDSMRDIYSRYDMDNDPITYHYVYNNFKERQHTIIFSIPLTFGFEFNYCYLAWGAKVGFPLYGLHNTSTDMYTEGIYKNLIQPISQNVPKYGYYPNSKYSYSGHYSFGRLVISPSFELGRTIYLSDRVICRLGAFFEYGICMQNKKKKNFLLDYDAVDLNPLSQSHQNLYENIRFNSIVNSKNNLTLQNKPGDEIVKGQIHNIQVGVKCTFVFQVIRDKAFCHCKK